MAYRITILIILLGGFSCFAASAYQTNATNAQISAVLIDMAPFWLLAMLVAVGWVMWRSVSIWRKTK